MARNQVQSQIIAVAYGYDAPTTHHVVDQPISRHADTPTSKGAPRADALARSLFDDASEQMPAHFVMRPGAAVSTIVDQHA